MEWRRPLGNVYTTLVMAAVCGLSLWATIPGWMVQLSTLDVPHDDPSKAYNNKTQILATQQVPLSLLCVVSGGLIAMRILGIPFLAMRGWFLNVIVTLSIVSLFVMSVLFVTQTLPTVETACDHGRLLSYFGSGTTSSGDKQSVVFKTGDKCVGVSTTYLIFYLVYAGVSALSLLWRLFGGSF